MPFTIFEDTATDSPGVVEAKAATFKAFAGGAAPAADPHDVTCRSLLRGFMSEAPAPARRPPPPPAAEARAPSGEAASANCLVRAAVGGGGAVTARLARSSGS